MTLKKHILFALGCPPKQGATGPVIVDRHLKRLSDSYKVSIVAPEQSFDGIVFPNSWQLIRIPKRRWWWIPYRAQISTLQKIRFWYWRKECEKILANQKPSIILTILHDSYSVYAAYLSKIWQIPLIVLLHDQMELVDKSVNSSIWFTKNWKFVFKQASRILPVSSELANAYQLSNTGKVRQIFPIPEGNRTSFVGWKEEFGASIKIAYAGNIYPSQFPVLVRLASTLLKINGKLLIITPTSKLELLKSLNVFPNVDFIEPFTKNVDVIDYLSSKVSSILVAYPLDISEMPWISTSFPSKLVEFCHLGLPILIIAPTETALGKWAISHNWLSYLSDMDEDKLLHILNKISEENEWLKMAEQSREVAQNEFNPEIIQSQFESEILSATSKNSHL